MCKCEVIFICRDLYLLQYLSIVTMLWHISAQWHSAKKKYIGPQLHSKEEGFPTACQTAILHVNKLPHLDSNLSFCISPSLNLHLQDY